MAPEAGHARPLQMLRARRPLSFFLGCAVLVSSAGCHYWQPETAFPQRPARHADDVRVTLRDGTRLYLEGAALEGDSLVGTGTLPDGSEARRAVPVAGIQKVERRWLHPGRTGGLVLGITFMVAIGIGIAAVASMGSINMNFGY